MNRYESSAPRAALGLGAVAMAALSIGALVVLPARLDSVAESYPLTVAPAATDARIERALSAARGESPEAASRHGRLARAMARLPDCLGPIASADDPRLRQCFAQALAQLFRADANAPARGAGRF